MKKSTYLYFIGLVAMAGVIFAQQTSTTTFVNPLPKDKFVFLEIIENNSTRWEELPITKWTRWEINPFFYYHQTDKVLCLDRNYISQDTIIYFAYLTLWKDMPYDRDYRRSRLINIESLPYIFKIPRFQNGEPIIIDTKKEKGMFTIEDEEKFKLIPFDEIVIYEIKEDGTIKLNIENEIIFLKPKQTITKQWKKSIKLEKRFKTLYEVGYLNWVEKAKKWNKGKREIITELKITNCGIIKKEKIELLNSLLKSWNEQSEMKIQRIKVWEKNDEKN